VDFIQLRTQVTAQVQTERTRGFLTKQITSFQEKKNGKENQIYSDLA